MMKKSLVVLAFCSICGLGFAQETPASAPNAAPTTTTVKFSLDEERYVAAFKKEGQARVEKEIEDAVGAKIPLEIEFDTFAGNHESMKYIEGSWCTGVIVGAMKNICTDDIGKKRMVAAVKKIVIKHDKEAEKGPFKLEGGTLTILTLLAKTGIESGALEEFLKKSI